MANSGNRVRKTLRSSGLRETAAAARGRVDEMGHQARESAGEFYEQGRERMLDMAGSIEHRVRDQPVRSLLVAMGIGCLLGAFFIRR